MYNCQLFWWSKDFKEEVITSLSASHGTHFDPEQGMTWRNLTIKFCFEQRLLVRVVNDVPAGGEV